MKRILAFFDTNVFTNSPRLERGLWPTLMDAIARGHLVAALSEVSLRELDRQAKEVRDELAGRVRKWEADPEMLSQLPLPSEQAGFGSCIQTVPVSEGFSHSDMLDWDLATRRPFDRNGNGYRDALIWLGLLDWMRATSKTGGEVVYFVTADGDFAEKRKGDAIRALHSDLAQDLAPNETIQIVDGLADLVALVPEIEESKSVAAIATVALSDYFDSVAPARRRIWDLLSDGEGGAAGAQHDPVELGDEWHVRWEQKEEQSGSVVVKELMHALGLEPRGPAAGDRRHVRVEMFDSGVTVVRRRPEDAARSAIQLEPSSGVRVSFVSPVTGETEVVVERSWAEILGDDSQREPLRG